MKGTIDSFLLSQAPMAGYTDEAFRMICARFGAQETVTEMVSARALYHGDKKSAQLMRTDPSECGVTVQIFGSEPEIMAEAVRRQINPLDSFSAIDINMGCPVPKIVKNGEGAALLRDEELACRIADSVVRASRLPVSVKIRLGWDHHSKNYLSIGKKLAQTGIFRITLHARTRSAFYSGDADWEAIREFASEMPIPVIGNGDITDVDTALHHIQDTNIQGIAIGRGSVGNPQLFFRITQALRGEKPKDYSREECAAIALSHLDLACEKKGETLGVIQMRKHLLQYVKGWENAGALKQAILRETTREGVHSVFSQYFQGQQIEPFFEIITQDS